MGLLAVECDWHKAADSGSAHPWRGFWVPCVNCSSVAPGCLLCIMLKTDVIKETPVLLSSQVPPLLIYHDSDSKSRTVQVGTVHYSGLLL